MIYYKIPPSPALASYVRFFWVLEGNLATGESYIHRSVADGSAEMIFHYNGLFETLKGPSTTTAFRAGVDGQSSQFRRYQVKESFGIFGAYLFPYAIPALFGHAAHLLSNQMPDLYTLLGQDGKDLEERMMLAKDNDERASVLSQVLLNRLQKSRVPWSGIFASISHIIQTKGTTDVQTLAGNVCLSTRQFERKFKESAGFSPKLYSRIIRFQAAIAKYGSVTRSLADVAYDCGYYDQSHFIHDIKEFSGYHPRHYFREETESTRWKDSGEE